MSLNINLGNGQDSIIQKSLSINEELKTFSTGQALAHASEQLNKCEEMNQLMSSINSSALDPKNKVIINGYLSELLDEDINNGLDMFARLMTLFRADKEYSIYKNLLTQIIESAQNLNKTEVFKTYAKAVLEFEQDNSDKAISVKNQIKEMQSR